MSRQAYKYFLFGDDNLPYYKDEASGFILKGNENYLKPDNEDASLVYSPQGWGNTLVKYGRNLTYWGLMRDMTVPMTFPRDGWDIIEYVKWKYGYDAVLKLGILKLDRFNLPYTYANWYLSQLNLVKYKKNRTSCTVEAIEGGMSKVLKAFEDTVFDIDIDSDPEVKNILLDGMKLIGAQTWLMGVQEWLDANLVSFAPTFPRLATEGQSTGLTFSDTIQTNINNLSLYLNTSNNYFAINDGDVPQTLELTGSFPLKLKKKRDQSFISIRIYKWNPAIGLPSQAIYYIFDRNLNPGDTPFTFEGEVRQITINESIPMNPGDQLFWYVTISAGTNTGQQSDWEIPQDGEYRANYSSKFRETYAKGLYPWTVFKRLVEKMTEGQNIFTADGLLYKSSWLENKRDIIITSQDALRQLPGSKIKTSIKMFYKSMSHWCASMGVENDKLFIELYDYVFKPGPGYFLDLGELTDPDCVVAEDLLFNTIKTGGPVVEYGDVNGKYEFTQESSWKTTVTAVTKELDLTTPYRRDPLGIEFARINFEGKQTTDDQGDNDVFMINVQNNSETNDAGTVFQRLFRGPYTLILGVPDPEGIFNIELSGKRSILNNMAIVNAGMDDPQYGKLITLTSPEKNADLVTEGYSTVTERAPIVVGSGNAALWRPYYISGKTNLPKNVLPLINANQYSRVRILNKGRSFYAYLWDGGVKPELNETQQWKMLSVKENDLLKFNR